METIDQLNALLADHSLLTAIAAIVFATLVSEDLTCIACGLLAARGDLPLVPAIVACTFGLWFGDLTLYGWGKFVGRPILRLRFVRRILPPQEVDNCGDWYERRGAIVIFLARVVPGCRLPTYFAAGLLGMNFFAFTLYALIATMLWAPLLVGGSMVIGTEILGYFVLFHKYALLLLILAVLAIYLVIKLVVPLFTFKGRRLLRGAIRRKVRWEYWPSKVFYIPIVAYILWLAWKHRSLSLFTTVNPGIYAGGFVNESKAEILAGLAGSPEFVAATERIPNGLPPEERLASVTAFREAHGFDYPVVLKPDAGQRGSGVSVIRSDDEALEYFRRSGVETLVQEHVPGEEFGVFYIRYPDQEKGRIFSITEKEFPVVRGDGVHDVESLILRDPALLPMAKWYLAKTAHRHYEVPAPGEEVRLIEIGNHCRGTVFRDGSWAWTQEIEDAIDRISRGFEGFFFGRYDLRAPTVEEFRAGRAFKIIELNGATSEATAIYDPRHSLFQAYRILFEQWRIAFEIAARNRALGAREVPLRELAGLVRRYRAATRTHPA